MSKPFIHLHVHTEYSLLDGAAPVARLIKRARETGAPAIALTDHGNMYATIKFYNACKENGIKPIIGCEFYVTDDLNKREGRLGDDNNKLNHLVLLAKNNNGYKNLSKLCSISWLKGLYYKPRIDLETLQKYSQDLVCMSACLAGAIPQLLLKNNYDGAKEYAKRLKGMFAEGDFYIELQNHGIEEQQIVNPLLMKIAREIGVKCVATNDVHYIDKEDAVMQDVMLCIQTAAFEDTPNRMRFETQEFYLKTYDEMKEVLGFASESLDTPEEIAEKCNIDFTFNEYQLPHYECPDNLTPDQYLRKLSFEGLKRRYGEIPEDYIKRAETELEVIISMGFAEYYLIVWDFINWAKSKDIPVGHGRGSGVGSIIAYAIGITNVEPMRYNLIFERFLNKDRTSMPDFDIDFCYNRRGEVIQYVKDKYGDDRISQIITFGKLKRKAAIKDVARVFRIPYTEVNKVSSHIQNSYGDVDKKVHIADLINPEHKFAVPELIEAYNNSPEWKKTLDIAAKIEGMPRNTSMHAAGVVIYKNRALDTVPLAKNGDEVTTQFDMIEVEKLGLLKMDFLALMTLTDIKMAHDYVLKRTGRDVDFEKIGYEDDKVFEMIGSGNTDAVFQLEGGGMKKFMQKFRPKNMEDILAGISLYRPGPMDNIDLFLKNRRDPENINYLHPLLKPILDVTSGIIVYQEQAMTITRVLAGYDMTRADAFRAIISKKKIDKIPAEREVFINGLLDKKGNVVIPGCVRNGVPKEAGLKIFKEMESFASYAFNKSHAAAYAFLSYETAFYKCYYPVEFMAAVLNNRIGKPDDTAKYMRVMKDDGIPLLQPDINKSESLFSPDGNAIRYGLSCIKNVGKAAIAAIITEREENGAFKSLYNFIERTLGTVNKRMIESLIKGGAFDCFNMTRASMVVNYEAAIEHAERKKKNKNADQLNFFDLIGIDDEEYVFDKVKEYPTRLKLAMEKEMLGMYVTGNPLAGYEKEFAEMSFNTSMLPEIKDDEDSEDIDLNEENNPYGLKDNMEVTTGGILSDVTIKRTKDGKEMAVCVLEDMYDRIELVAFSRTLTGNKQYLIKDSLVKISGRLGLSDKEAKITINKIRPWNLAEKEEEEICDGRIMYINLNGVEEKYDKITAILNAHPGLNSVRFQRGKQLFESIYKVGSIDVTAKEIAGVVGADNVVIK